MNYYSLQSQCILLALYIHIYLESIFNTEPGNHMQRCSTNLGSEAAGSLAIGAAAAAGIRLPATAGTTQSRRGNGATSWPRREAETKVLQSSSFQPRFATTATPEEQIAKRFRGLCRCPPRQRGRCGCCCP